MEKMRIEFFLRASETYRIRFDNLPFFKQFFSTKVYLSAYGKVNNEKKLNEINFRTWNKKLYLA